MIWCQRPDQVGTVQFKPGPDADTIPRRIEPLPKLYNCLLKIGLKKPETCKAEINKEKKQIQKPVHYVGYCTISFQTARSLQHKTYNRRKSKDDLHEKIKTIGTHYLN
jgi:hypothetical protein